jgi:hypothetical protein
MAGWQKKKDEQPPQEDQQEQQSQQPPQGGSKKQEKSWRAKVDCTYKGRRIKQGEFVQASEMKNSNFEEVKGK